MSHILWECGFKGKREVFDYGRERLINTKPKGREPQTKSRQYAVKS